jgi:HD-GYP domain-containing protein (c-di-GMP phosphodiesterase class II)
MGQELEEGLRCCFLALRLAGKLSLPPEDVTTIYYGSLLKHGGCTCNGTALASLFESDEIAARLESWLIDAEGPAGFASWVLHHPGRDLAPPGRVRAIARTVVRAQPVFREVLAETMDVCTRIARRLQMPPAVLTTLANMAEVWDGKGVPRGLRGDEIPLTSQVLFGAMSFQVIHRYRGRKVVCDFALKQKGKMLAPRIVDAFLDLARDDDFWDGLESESIAGIVRAMEPDSELADFPDDRLDEVALAFADFIDLKSPHTSAHSRRVAEISAQVALLAGCREPEVTNIRRGALMHDLGIVAVPAHILNRPEATLRTAEKEAMRLHPYHGERILDRSSVFAPIKSVVGSHHERVDGTGYFRGLRDKEIPLGARIVAVADLLDELTHSKPGRPAFSVEEALAALNREAGASFDAEIVAAVSKTLGHHPAPPVQRSWPAGLSDREVEVLRLTASGMSRKEVAHHLSISDNTVKHHLDHIYTKTGSSSKVAATLFAMENGLLP